MKLDKRALLSVVLCTLGWIGVLGLTTGFTFNSFKSTVNEPLKSVVFYTGGDMQGSTKRMSVRALDNDTALVCYESAAWHNEALSVKEYLVSATVLDEIKSIFNKNKMLRYEKAPKAPFFAHDAGSSGYIFTFEKQRVAFSSNQVLPESAGQALKSIRSCVEAACAQGQRLPGLVLGKNEQGEMLMRNVMIKGKIGVTVVGYNDRCLTVSLGNGLEKEASLDLATKLTKLEQPEITIYEDKTDETIKIPKLSDMEHNINLPHRLEAGRYALTIGGYSTEFVIR